MIKYEKCGEEVIVGNAWADWGGKYIVRRVTLNPMNHKKGNTIYY